MIQSFSIIVYQWIFKTFGNRLKIVLIICAHSELRFLPIPQTTATVTKLQGCTLQQIMTENLNSNLDCFSQCPLAGFEKKNVSKVCRIFFESISYDNSKMVYLKILALGISELTLLNCPKKP